jgi:hypothetical protein
LTIVLLRHAEKDASPNADRLTRSFPRKGKLRAARLVKTIDKYKPDAIFPRILFAPARRSRTLAEKRKLQVQTYDHRNLKQLADLIMSGK